MRVSSRRRAFCSWPKAVFGRDGLVLLTGRFPGSETPTKGSRGRPAAFRPGLKLGDGLCQTGVPPSSHVVLLIDSTDPKESDHEVIDALGALVAKRTRWGFWKCYDRLRLNGHQWNHKRVHRVYCAMRLNVGQRTKRRIPKRLRQPLMAPSALNVVWALDFMRDTLYSGRALRTLNVIDEANREVLAIEVGVSIPSARVVRVLEQLVEIYGCPKAVRCDNGPEFVAQAFMDWAKQSSVEVIFIQHGKPDQNAFVERFNRTYRQEVLNAHLFGSVAQAQEITDRWMQDYRTTTSTGRTMRWGRFLQRPIFRGPQSRKSPVMNCVLDGEAYEATRTVTERIHPD